MATGTFQDDNSDDGDWPAPVKIDGWFYPVDNPITRRNLANSKGLDRVLAYVEDWSVAIDGGAYVGGWARPLAERFETVIAVEIDPANAACLRLNAPKAGVITACLAEHSDERVGFEGDRDVVSPVRRVIKGDYAKTLSIDSLNLQRCGLLKLDLQGYDTFALYGARETLERCHPVIVYEHVNKCYVRYGLNGDEAGHFLSGLGATQIAAGHDPIWVWL